LIETPSRGQLLYENQCIACHESVVHIRSNRGVKSLPELQAAVARWATYAKPSWDSEEIEEVTRYLDSRYYKFEK
jgi:mono/diheme cytochrome c family protein